MTTSSDSCTVTPTVAGVSSTRARTRGRGMFRIALVASGALIFLGVADAAVLWHRVDRFEVAFPEVADGVDTWLLVGSDDRRFVPDAVNVETFGSPETVPTRSADVLLLFQRDRAGSTRLLGLNRDLVLPLSRRGGRETFARLGPELEAGEQALVDLLCTGLGVSVDHLVRIDFAGLVELVDQAGGVRIDVDEPVRDSGSGLLLDHAGRQRLDGVSALAWIRSRFPEHMIDGEWIPIGPTAGDRPGRGMAVLQQLVSRLGTRRSPLGVHRMLWRAGPHIGVDNDTTARELFRLGRWLGGVETVDALPVQYGAIDPVPIARLEDAGVAVLGAMGSETCRVR